MRKPTRKHTEYKESNEERVTVVRTFDVYECDYCDETFSVDSDLPSDEIDDLVQRHVESEHPEQVE